MSAIPRLLLLLLLLCCATQAQASDVEEVVDAAAAAFQQAYQSTAIAVGVIHDHHVVLLKTYGTLRKDQPFDLASLSKCLTAMVAVKYIEEGKLKLDAPVTDYLPEVHLPPGVTVKRLLSHTSGLPHYSEAFPSSGYTLANFTTEAMKQAPGQGYIYSSPGYVLLSKVLERVDSHPFLQQINQGVAIPAGATPLQMLPEDGSWLLGSGGLMATPESMTQIALAILAGKILSPAGYELLWTPVAVEEGMALGFYVDEGPPIKISHTGAHPEDGVATRWVLFPESGDGLVIFTQNRAEADVSSLSTAIIQGLKP